MTEVEAPEITEIDPHQPETRKQLAELSEHFLVESAEGRLVSKSSEAQ